MKFERKIQSLYHLIDKFNDSEDVARNVSTSSSLSTSNARPKDNKASQPDDTQSRSKRKVKEQLEHFLGMGVLMGGGVPMIQKKINSEKSKFYFLKKK